MKRSQNKISAKIIVGLITSFLIIIAIQGQSIWNITNPIPPWDEYKDVQFINDQTGWAVGYEGQIIKSTNGGLSWFELNSTGTNSLSCLYFFDLNDGWVAGNGIYKTTDGGSSWEYNFGMNENNFRSIQFISDQIGYTGNYNGKVFKTTDGGMSWDLNYEFGSPIVKIFFLGEFTGWALSWHDILTTTDGGENWAEISLPAWNTKFNDVQFIDENRGWIVSDNGLLMGSVYGGLAWDTIQTPATTYDDLVAVHFFNEVNGRVFSKNKCYITTDGGISWEVANAPYMYNQAACFPSENVGYTVGERMYYTNDAGYNWEQSDIGHTFYQSSICIVNDQQIYIAGGDGKIMLSNDSGISWVEQETPTEEYLTDIYATNDETLWITGTDGTLLYTTDGGENWILKDIDTDRDLNAITMYNNQTGICVGNNGTIFTSQDAGGTWNEVTVNTSSGFNDVVIVNENIGLICGNLGKILRTDDGGSNWESVESNTNNRLYDMHFMDENKGWIAGKEIILSTDDGGLNFYVQLEDLPAPYNYDDFYSINFTNGIHGWACGENGLLIHTKDGGMNWVIHNAIIDNDLYDIAYLNEEEWLAVGDKGYILYTNKGTYLAPHLVSQSTDTILCEGSAITFECEVIGDSLNFQWLYTGEPIVGAIDSILIFDSISIFEGGLYSCKIFNEAGTIITDEFMVSVKPNASITGHPQDEVAYENDTVTFNLAVTGALPIYYQWQKNGEDIPGAVYNVYPIYGVQLSDSGYYRCIVSNDCNVDTTLEAKLTVLPASGINEKNGRQFHHNFSQPGSGLFKDKF